MSFISPGNSSGPAATPGGPSGAVQYNSAGTFAGESEFSYDPTLDRLSVGNIKGSTQSSMTIQAVDRSTVGPGYNLNLTGGLQGLAAISGGAVVLSGSDSAGSGSGGGVSLRGGSSSTGAGGSISIQPLQGASGGAVTINGGGANGIGGFAGNVTIRAGFSTVSSANHGVLRFLDAEANLVMLIGNVGTAGALSFFNTFTPVVQQNVTGSWGGNVAGKNLAVALAAYGLIVDSTTA